MSACTGFLEQSIAEGLEYILARQSSDGSWIDWNLPPGNSSVWTTGYVGHKLKDLPAHLKAKAAGQVALASQWLLDRQFPDGGWGYDLSIGSDSDSTSLVILFLTEVPRQVPGSAYEHLLRYQQPDGGFTTYLPLGEPHSWNVSHPDVTPVALAALLTRYGPQEDAVRRGIAQVRQQRTRDGVWNSFWWDSFLYGTEASLSLLRQVGVPTAPPAKLSSVEPTNVFETALLLLCWMRVEPSAPREMVERFTGRLLSEQQPDGSWPSKPILRITWRECYEPWIATDSGPLFADPHKLFTSVTALHALSQACALK